MDIISWILFGILAAIALVFGVIWIIGWAIYKLLSSKDQATGGEDARLLQELNARLSKLEKRIETLETIVTAAENPPKP